MSNWWCFAEVIKICLWFRGEKVIIDLFEGVQHLMPMIFHASSGSWDQNRWFVSLDASPGRCSTQLEMYRPLLQISIMQSEEHISRAVCFLCNQLLWNDIPYLASNLVEWPWQLKRCKIYSSPTSTLTTSTPLYHHLTQHPPNAQPSRVIRGWVLHDLASKWPIS